MLHASPLDDDDEITPIYDSRTNPLTRRTRAPSLRSIADDEGSSRRRRHKDVVSSRRREGLLDATTRATSARRSVSSLLPSTNMERDTRSILPLQYIIFHHTQHTDLAVTVYPFLTQHTSTNMARDTRSIFPSQYIIFHHTQHTSTNMAKMVASYFWPHSFWKPYLSEDDAIEPRPRVSRSRSVATFEAPQPKTTAGRVRDSWARAHNPESAYPNRNKACVCHTVRGPTTEPPRRRARERTEGGAAHTLRGRNRRTVARRRARDERRCYMAQIDESSWLPRLRKTVFGGEPSASAKSVSITSTTS